MQPDCVLSRQSYRFCKRQCVISQIDTGPLCLSRSNERVPAHERDVVDKLAPGWPYHPYYAMVTSLDDCMGRLCGALDEAGLTEDTIVVFTSDHGDMLGSQGHGSKQRPWEESINIPFILRYPRRVKAVQRRDWIVSSVDVMPTLLGFCGAPIPENVQGMDFSKTFMGQSTDERDAAFLFNVHKGNGPGCDWRGIRTKKWVYAYHSGGDWVMYDLENDPYELHNLVDSEDHAEVKDDLRARLEAVRNELGEALPLKGLPRQPIRVPEDAA